MWVPMSWKRLKTAWLRRRRVQELRAGIRLVRAEYDPKLRTAAKQHGPRSEEYRSLDSERHFFESEYAGELEAIDTGDLFRQARQFLVDTSDIDDPWKEDSPHWETGSFGHKYLSDSASLILRRRVQHARREHFKELRERWTFGFSIAAGIIGLALTVYNTAVTHQRLSQLGERVSAIERLAAPSQSPGAPRTNPAALDTGAHQSSDP